MLRLTMLSAIDSGIQTPADHVAEAAEGGDRRDGDQAVLGRGLDRVADVQVVRPGLGEVLEGVHGRVRRDVRRLPPLRRALGVVPLDRGLVVRDLVAEELAAARRADRHRVPAATRRSGRPRGGSGRAWCGRARPSSCADLLPVGVVALGEVDGDHAVLRARSRRCPRRSAGAGEQVEGQPVLGVGDPVDHREAEGVELDDQVPLGRSASANCSSPSQVVVGRPGPGQVARRALAALERRQPGAAGEVEVARTRTRPGRPGRRTVRPRRRGRSRAPPRENPRAVPQETHTEFSKYSWLSQTRQR